MNWSLIGFFFSSPNCRCDISKSNCTRNLAVEKTISELPIQCDYCFETYLRSEINIHQTENCRDRPSHCDYAILGCLWNGSVDSLRAHLDQCEYPLKSGVQLIDTIRAQKKSSDEEKKCLETVVDLLSLNQIGVSGRYKDFIIANVENSSLFFHRRFNSETFSNRWFCCQIIFRNVTFHSFTISMASSCSN